MGIRSDWNDKAVFSECPTCQHLGPHQPDELGMLHCDVCGTTFAAATDGPTGEAGTYVDTRPDEATPRFSAATASWIPKLPDQG